MKILKYIILFIIFMCSVIIGLLIAQKYKNRVNQLIDFKQAINILENKIKFTYEPLGNIFGEINKMFKTENGISYIFKKTNENMKYSDITDSWEKAIDEAIPMLNLNKEDVNIIKGLGKLLGKTDIEGQISEIELTNNFVDVQLKKAEQECMKNEKLYKTLGIIIGIGLIIILI